MVCFLLSCISCMLCLVQMTDNSSQLSTLDNSVCSSLSLWQPCPRHFLAAAVASSTLAATVAAHAGRDFILQARIRYHGQAR